MGVGKGEKKRGLKDFQSVNSGRCQLQWLMGLRSHCSRPENLRTSTFGQRPTDQERGG